LWRRNGSRRESWHRDFRQYIPLFGFGGRPGSRLYRGLSQDSVPARRRDDRGDRGEQHSLHADRFPYNDQSSRHAKRHSVLPEALARDGAASAALVSPVECLLKGAIIMRLNWVLSAAALLAITTCAWGSYGIYVGKGLTADGSVFL